MRKILIAPDSFKESLSASEVAASIAKGLSQSLPDAELIELPVADGGEGTTQALVDATQGTLHTAEVTGPLGDPIEAFWGLLGDGKTAVVEMAAASGLDLVPTEQRNPLITTTYGTGELILAAAQHGVSRIIVGLGGSATNDGGVGMLQALGIGFYDQDQQPLGFGGGALSALASIDVSTIHPDVTKLTFDVACDVDNPLCGDKGASAIFGPQKGATPELVKQLDNNLRHYADCVLHATGEAVADIPGAGAAGGLGAAFCGFLNATLRPGVDIVLDAVGFEHKLAGVDLVITGEGRIDGQSVHGKTPVGVARRAKAYNSDITVIALAGSLGDGAEAVNDVGIDALFSVVPGVVSLESALSNASDNLMRTGKNLGVLLR